MASTANQATAEITQEIDQIDARYNLSFAGQPRATRDLQELQQLIARMKSAVAKLEKIPAAGELLSRARELLSTYESEHQAIAAAKAAGPESVDFSRLAAFANNVFARYGRHFAGQSRDTRDLGLIKELVEELRTIRQRMSAILATGPNTSFQRDADLVTSMIDRYAEEAKQIEKAYTSGSPEEQASRLADLANAQFDLYRTHFLGQSRITRRPALLQRIIENLRRIRAAMQNLRLSGKVAENTRANLGIVDQNLKHDDSELVAIRKERQAATLVDIMGMLGGAANAVFDDYRKSFGGRDRRTVDLAALGVLCDKLSEIGRQMADLGRTEPNEMNENNLEIVIEQLAEYEQEYRAVAKAKSGEASPPDSAPPA